MEYWYIFGIVCGVILGLDLFNWILKKLDKEESK